MLDQFRKMVEKWPSSMVARSQVGQFTGGAISGKTLANLSSRGEPTPPALRIGGRIVYEAEGLADWLRKRSSEAA